MISTENLNKIFEYNETLDAYIQSFDDVFEATIWKDKMREIHPDLNFEQKNNRILITQQLEVASV